LEPSEGSGDNLDDFESLDAENGNNEYESEGIDDNIIVDEDTD